MSKKNILDKLRIYSRKGYVFRFQPSGAKLSGYSSISYTVGAEGMEEELKEGVWAFVGLMNAIRDMYSTESYVEDIERDGYKAELVVLKGDIEDGPEDFVIVHKPKIIERFDVEKIIKECDPHYDDEDEELDDDFLDSLY